jgi:Ni,Fe-hydrogenase I small subunit
MADLLEKGRVIDICPVCGHKFIDEPETIILLSTFLMLDENGRPIPAMPKLLCTNCGIEFYPKDILMQINENVAKGQSKLVLVKPGFKLN